MACVLFTVILTSAGWVALLPFGLRRVPDNMKHSPEAAAAITKHVLTPLFGDKEGES